MTSLIYAMLAIFTVLCATGIVSCLWMMAFAFKMSREFADPSLAYSRHTLWNPMNVILQPNLLNEKGLKSRQQVFRGAIAFLISWTGGVGAYGVAWLLMHFR